MAAIVYVAFAVGLGRSSWAVLGALGLFLAAGHFASEWSGGAFELFDGEATTDWAPLVVFAVLGFLLVALGLLVERRRTAAP